MNVIIARSALTLIPIFLLLCPLLSVAQTTVYQWQDESGNVVFGDRPRSGSREIRIPEAPVYTPPPLPADTTHLSPEKQKAPAYQGLQLAEPQPGATIWDNRGNFQIRYEISPPLRAQQGHRLVVSLDGKARPPIAGARYYFENINRGAHQLKGRIINTAGKVLIESDPATIYLQQQSIHYPER